MGITSRSYMNSLVDKGSHYYDYERDAYFPVGFTPPPYSTVEEDRVYLEELKKKRNGRNYNTY